MGASETRLEQRYQDLVHKTGCKYADMSIFQNAYRLIYAAWFSNFSLQQIKNLHKRFQQLSGNEETIRIMASLLSHCSRENLDSISALANNPIRKEITEAFFDKRNQHQGEEGFFQEINFEQFLIVMSHFRPPTLKTTEEEKLAMRREKLRFLFNMHDTDNDGKITLEEYRKVVEELLSKSSTIGPEPVSAIADAAMLEVASTITPHMGPDEIYEGITFEHFEQILKGLEIESRMFIRFLDVDTTTMHCGNGTS
ncbi:hypothetical protein LDENG_00034210 [Lucifuga dentata]|nr:hypothetical protein LDENG_00034210 [Lucifuga dentata]